MKDKVKKVLDYSYELRHNAKRRVEECEGILSFTPASDDVTAFFVLQRKDLMRGFEAALTGIIIQLEDIVLAVENEQSKEAVVVKDNPDNKGRSLDLTAPVSLDEIRARHGQVE